MAFELGIYGIDVKIEFARELGLEGDKLAKIHGIMERQVNHLVRLVDDLLALARSDAGQEPVITRMALDSLFLEVYHQQRPLAGRVRLLLGEFQPVEVDGDADRLKQLLLNLVDNALRYTPAGGSVTLWQAA